MSLRDSFPKARVSSSHFFLTMARGDDMRCIAVRPWTLYKLAGIVPLVALIYLGATAWFVFHDRMLSALMTRQAEMQAAYEDRLAAMRAQVDRVASRQLLDQDSLENRVQDLVARQAQLETRAVVVATLAEGAGIDPQTTASIAVPLPPTRGAPSTASIEQSRPAGVGGAVGGAFQQPVSAFAPVEMRNAPALRALETIVPARPRPEPVEAEAPALRPGQTSDATKAVPLGLHLAEIAAKLDKVERLQIGTVGRIAATAAHKTARLRTALAPTGLSLDRLTPPRKTETSSVGGPFVPFKADPNGSPFEREVARLQDQIALAARLQQVLPYLPLRRPLSSIADVTSTFGVRTDPFLGRAALHTGIDLREAFGAPVQATAAGRVVSAGPNGGYGNMVEVDHGNGVATRYAHMSSILVSEGQQIAAGAVVGRLGSTGRSTGAHLHYEVRIDDEPVDPARFLRAGTSFFAQR